MFLPKFYEALEVVLYIAINGGGRLISSSELCKYKSVAPRYLETLMKILVENNILKGITGPKGGYALAKEKRKITVWQIAKLFIVPVNHDILKTSIMTYVNSFVEESIVLQFDKLFSSINIEDLCKRLDFELKTPKEKGDFTI